MKDNIAIPSDLPDRSHEFNKERIYSISAVALILFNCSIFPLVLGEYTSDAFEAGMIIVTLLSLVAIVLSLIIVPFRRKGRHYGDAFSRTFLISMIFIHGLWVAIVIVAASPTGPRL